MKTQIVISQQNNPYLNLSVETYLTDHQEEDQVTMYLWANRRTVVIGLHQNPYSECNSDMLIGDGGFLMRRRTGGGAVYHDLGNLNFSFIADKRIYDVPRQMSVIQKALRHYGLEAVVSGRNDLTIDGRKFSGNAFYNGPLNHLHHGTILIRTDAEAMQRYLRVNKAKLAKNGVKSVASRIVNLSELADVTATNIVDPLIAAFQDVYGMTPNTIDFDTLAQLPEVQAHAARVSTHEYLFGKWEHFHAVKKEQFAWGGVEVGLDIDSARQTIRECRIASDCLDTDIIGQAENLLVGASTLTPPSIQQDNAILKDIIGLIYA